MRRDSFPTGVVLTREDRGHWVVQVSEEVFPQVMRMLYGLSSFDFKLLTDRTAVDYPSRTPRWDVVYQLQSIRYAQRCMVKRSVEDGQSVPSVTGRYASARWAERECFDMFGVIFDGHADLRRLLTDYGFEGHPLRKDFPLTGYTEVRYDETAKRVVSEPVERSQDIRFQEPALSWQVLPETLRVKGGQS